MDKTTPLTEFDIQTVPWLIQLCKAALPFFDANMQRSFAMMLRFWEFKSTIEFFKFHSLKNPAVNCTSNDVFNHGSGFSFNFEYIKELAADENFQKCIEPYCPAPIFGIIRNYKMFAGMSEIFKNYSDVSDVFNSDSSCINPTMMYLSGAQKSMYDEYMKQLENIF
jgi:hypothetical protein